MLETNEQASSPITTVTLQRFLRFPFGKSGWQRSFIIGSALIFAGFLIPIVPWVFVAGYAAEIMRRVMKGHDPTLLPWQDWQRLGRDGIRILAVTAVFLLPGTFVLISSLALYMWASIAVPLALEGLGSDGAVVAIITLGLLALTALFMMTWAVGSLLILLGLIPLPMALACVVDERRLTAAFRVTRWAELIHRDVWGYIVSWVLAAGILTIGYTMIALAIYSMVFCAAVPLLSAPLAFYTLLVNAAFFGHAYARAVAAETQA